MALAVEGSEPLRQFAEIGATWLLPSGLLAFGYNAIAVMFMQEPQAYISNLASAGLVKEVVLVAGSTALWGDAVSRLQWIGWGIMLISTVPIRLSSLAAANRIGWGSSSNAQ